MTGRRGDIRGQQAQETQEDVNVGSSFTFIQAISLSTPSSPQSPCHSHTKAQAECKQSLCTVMSRAVIVKLRHDFHGETPSWLKDAIFRVGRHSHGYDSHGINGRANIL